MALATVRPVCVCVTSYRPSVSESCGRGVPTR